MTSAAAVVQRVPIFGRMFQIDESTGLESINTWPSIIVLTSFVWLAIAVLIGLAMPVIQLMGLSTNLFYAALTLHGAAMVLPFSFQLMVGVGLHRTAGCIGTPVSGVLTPLFFVLMNVGSLLFTLAVFGGLKISVLLMYPLPLVGAEMGQWSMGSVVLGFTGLVMILASMIIVYPLKALRMLFVEERREELILSPRSMMDPGMFGMMLGILVLVITGVPLVVVGTTMLLGLYGILPTAMVSWATEPVVFQYVWYIFAHNLMEVMAVMVTGALYATVPLYLADGTRELYSNRLANLAMTIMTIFAFTAFLHHFYNLTPTQPAALAVHGNIMSWGIGTGVALTIFNILATIWKHGLKPEPGIVTALLGFALYVSDGVNAMVEGTVANNVQLHGTMFISGHSMIVIIAISLMWMGILYHHYPVITGRKLNSVLGYRSIKLTFIGAFGLMASFQAGGAAGMPRRFAEWAQGGWMIFGVLILLFGLLLTAGYVMYFYNLAKSREISQAPGQAAPSAV